MKSSTKLFIRFVFWIITFFSASNLLSFNKFVYCYAHYLFINDIKLWIKFVSTYFLKIYSIEVYRFCGCCFILIGDYFWVEILLTVLILCEIWELIKFLTGFLWELVEMLGKIRDELNECKLESRLMLLSLLK